VFTPYDPYQQINATPTPLLTIKRPDTFDLLMQESPASRLSCFSLVAPILESLTVIESPASALSCVRLHNPGPIYLNESESSASDLSCDLLISPVAVPIPATDDIGSDLSCALLFHPTEIDVPAADDIGGTISCISLYHPMNSLSFPLATVADGDGLAAQFVHGLAAAPSYLRGVWICTNADTFLGPETLWAVGDEIDLIAIYDTGNNDTGNGITADAVNVYLSSSPQQGSNWRIFIKGTSGFHSPVSTMNFSFKVYWY
jgi:hypothetical protein